MNDDREIANAEWHWETATFAWLVATLGFLCIVIGSALIVHYFLCQ